ncbi:hypothetical protein MMB17_15895 [Methylobacterium organophilum]|uniref:hypothetical protein n=1 Tax=Methylobacterium organophilum TaxID=410 RepID=UPI001F139BDE|nr:hypothetical protein [Methylobacterium organophilum]UMY16196.1 hypothetical protein MMB17_15895 [Methylobacterium organophilum]
MTDPYEIKNRFRRRLQAADARKNQLRRKLLEDGTKALQPIISVLSLMAEVLDEDRNAAGTISGLTVDVDKEDFVCLTANLHNSAGSEHKIGIKYGPVLGGRNYICVSGLSKEYSEKLLPELKSAAPSLGRSVGNEIHFEEERSGEIAEVVRDLVEDFYAGHVEPWSRPAAGDGKSRLMLVQ